MYSMKFEWHDTKAKNNARKHEVTFEEAVTCFYDLHQVAFYDPEHSEDEDREIVIAHSKKGRLLLVCYVIRGEIIRLISARLATKQEVKDYEEGL